MKTRLFLIITAILAAYPCGASAEDAAREDTELSSYGETIGEFSSEEAGEEIPEIPELENEVISIGDEDSAGESRFEEDVYAAYEEAQLSGDEVAWDGTTLAEVTPVDGVYEISNGAQLAWIADRVNAGNGGMCGETIRLTADIDLGGHLWTPVGYDHSKPFAGTFDGNGHTVRNLNFDASSYTHAGLFGCVIGTVSNVTVSSADGGITTARRVDPSNYNDIKTGIGIVAGTVEKRVFDYNTKEFTGCIEDCVSVGELKVTNTYNESFYVGGIAGANSSALLVNNKNHAAISVESVNTDADRAVVGGITGLNDGDLYGIDYVGDAAELSEAGGGQAHISVVSSSPCIGMEAGENTGTINGANTMLNASASKNTTRLSADCINIGGIAGRNSGKIEYSTVSGAAGVNIESVNESAFVNIGGISGELSGGGIITDCNAGLDMAASAAASVNIGGITGYASGINSIITDCKTDGLISVSEASYRVCAGGIAGASYALIDSCAPNMGIDVKGTDSIAAGAAAGVSYNSINDCVSAAALTLEGASELSPVYGGGIAGNACGRVLRCSYNGRLRVTGALSYAGGIAGRAEYDADNSILSDEGANRIGIEKCSALTDSVIEGNYISGGIIGYGANADIISGSFRGTVTGAQGSGCIAGTAMGLGVSDCFIEGTNSSAVSAAGVYSIAGGSFAIKNVYFAPVLNGAAKYILSEEDMAKCAVSGVYVNTDRTAAAWEEWSVTDETSKNRAAFTELDFKDIWTMGTASPVLQHEIYSNAVNSVGDITERKMNFRINLENPKAGQRIYVALYDENDRFCGTVSAVCSDEDINATNTRADIALEYKYDYWTFTDPTDPSTWAPNKGLPAKARAFTWDEENGMRSLSSVDEDKLEYSFE